MKKRMYAVLFAAAAGLLGVRTRGRGRQADDDGDAPRPDANLHGAVPVPFEAHTVGTLRETVHANGRDVVHAIDFHITYTNPANGKTATTVLGGPVIIGAVRRRHGEGDDPRQRRPHHRPRPGIGLRQRRNARSTSPTLRRACRCRSSSRRDSRTRASSRHLRRAGLRGAAPPAQGTSRSRQRPAYAAGRCPRRARERRLRDAVRAQLAAVAAAAVAAAVDVGAAARRPGATAEAAPPELAQGLEQPDRCEGRGRVEPLALVGPGAHLPAAVGTLELRRPCRSSRTSSFTTAGRLRPHSEAAEDGVEAGAQVAQPLDVARREVAPGRP